MPRSQPGRGGSPGDSGHGVKLEMPSSIPSTPAIAMIAIAPPSAFLSVHIAPNFVDPPLGSPRFYRLPA